MKFIGDRPERLGIVSKLYDQYTATHLTESLMNTFTLDRGKKELQSVNSYLIEWDVQVKKLERHKIIAAPEGNGLNKSDIKFYFGNECYHKNETFVVENTRQQFIVVNRPQRLRDNCYLVIAKILDNDYDSVVDTLGGTPESMIGWETRFITNYQPELHQEGYTRFQSNLERMRTHISTHRNDIDYSAQYAAMEDIFISIGSDKKGDVTYRLDPAEKTLMDCFMEDRNNKLLWGKSDVDETGKATIQDADGRPIITGDGIIAQIERYAAKYVFNRLNVNFFERALQTIAAKNDKPTGLTFTLICNTAFYTEWQRVMNAWIIAHRTDGAFLYSKATNGMIDLGATYQSYEWAGRLYCSLL